MLDLDPQLMHMRDNIGASLAHYAASGGHEGVLEFLDVKVPELVRFWSSSLIFSCSWELSLVHCMSCFLACGVVISLLSAVTDGFVSGVKTNLPFCTTLFSSLLWT